LIKYADDLVALCHTRDEAEQVKARLTGWLAPRGLTFNEGKTRIVTLDDGFDFLGVTVRRQSGKLLLKPSKAALRRVRERLRTEVRALRGANAAMVLVRLNPIIRGWAAYYRTVVSSEAFAALDRYLWRLLYKWAKFTHPNKSKHWIVDRYFGAFNKSRRDRWVFGDRASGAYLTKFAWTGIVRHRMVKGTSSPDDPALAQYWADRRRRGVPPMDQLGMRLLKTQAGRCACCGDLLLHADHPPQSPSEWEQWVRVTGKALRKQSLSYRRHDGSGETSSLRLIHTRCRAQRHAAAVPGQRFCPAHEPSGLA
jgi:RNA-directed DNA polymerase